MNEQLSEVIRGRDQVIQQVASVLDIGGGSPPRTVEEFWYQVALNIGIVLPEHGVLNMARQVLERLDQEWDDDYVNDEDGLPSLEAYETLYESVKAWKETAERQGTDIAATDIEEAEDEDDDSIGAVTREIELHAETTQTNIETTLNNIAKGSLVLNPDWQRNFVWKLKKQRRLIESILLGLPIPSLLLFRDSVLGLEYVIDGRQRLETLARFASPKPAKNEKGKRFRTFPAAVEAWRPGEKLNAASNTYYDDLPAEFKTKFNKAAIVIHTFVDLPRQKLYQIFKRYNTGAERLKAAEIRNAVYQAAPLHVMMYRLGGEGLTEQESLNDEERRCTARLRSIMRSKTARYGAYDFIGRYFAFSRMTGGSVANATIEFMEKFDRSSPDELRDEFIRVFNKTCEWYEYALITPEDGGKFHAFLATIQMVASREMLYKFVDKGRMSEEVVRKFVATRWVAFATETLEQKQNSTAFWSRQKDWIAALEGASLTEESSN